MKYPMKHQRMFMKRYGLNPKKWTVTAENHNSITVANVKNGIVCVLDKKRGAKNE